jgi:O-antigen/teichoic acid export membrane protein
MVYGVLQGRQRFFWLGWAMLSLGVVRLAAVAGLVFAFDDSALNGMVGVGLGFLCAFLIAGTTSGLPSLHPAQWLRCVTQIDWRSLLKKFVPLSLGAGAGIYMMSVDMVVVQRFFDKEQTGLYAAAGMIGRALIFFVGPMVMVMFPKIVRSRAEQKPTDVLRLTLLLTAGLCVVAGGLGFLVPELPLKLVYDKSFLAVAPLVTWFIWAMVPLALAVVLVNNLLARSDYAVAYALPVVCTGYTIALVQAAPGLVAQTAAFNVEAYIGVTKILGAGNLAFLAVAGFFTGRHYRSSTNPPSAVEVH